MIPKTIKSFVIRQRTTVAQARAIQEMSAKFILTMPLTNVDWSQVYGNHNPLIIEIGFGMGDATWQIAKNNPDLNYLAIDVHEAGIGALLIKIADQALSNVRIIEYDAVEVLKDVIQPHSVLGFHIFCPDPWPKRRHWKRRLLQADFIVGLMRYLQTGGYIHIITDHADYKDFIEKAIKSVNLKYNLYRNSPYNNRPQTRFEQKSRSNGGDIWDFIISAL